MDDSVCVVGLGYVGLPLAIEFGKIYSTFGFDIDDEKIKELKSGFDRNGEVLDDDFRSSSRLEFTSDPACIGLCKYIIIAVPTPVDISKSPDFTYLKAATELVGKYMNIASVVIYESTVYPGATEEICVPLLEFKSGMRWKTDFNVGYSPERINPGDSVHKLSNIIKVVSADSAATLSDVAHLYSKIVHAGIYQASSIKVAEAAKVIENTQRDINIALMNELSIIFNKMGISTSEVLQAARTKWNFLDFKPGLVGGHCISVDPYYLTHKASALGYHSRVILAGRQINDGMPDYVVYETISLLTASSSNFNTIKAIIFGATFKEDCSDTRNSQAIDIYNKLNKFIPNLDIYDPYLNEKNQPRSMDLRVVKALRGRYDLVIIAVAHKEFKAMGLDRFLDIMSKNCLLIDVKSIFDKKMLTENNIQSWQL